MSGTVLTSPGSCGISEEYRQVHNTLQDIKRHVRDSDSGQLLENFHKQLSEVYEECKEPNWDGYNANPVKPEVYFEAVKLIDLFPLEYPLPDIVPEPSGAIGFEWQREDQYRYAISVTGNGIITYAGLFGPGIETCGTELFIDSLPDAIMNHLRRFFRKRI